MSLVSRDRWWIGFRAVILSIVVFLIGSGSLILSQPAAAHVQLISSSPKDGKTLNEAPSEVSLKFSGALIAGSDTVVAESSSGTDTSRLVASVNQNRITAEWPTGWNDGSFQLSYRVASSDGHIMTGDISFTVDPKSGPTPPESPDQTENEASTGGSAAAVTASDQTDAGAVPLWLWVGGLAALVVALLWWQLVGRRGFSDD